MINEEIKRKHRARNYVKELGYEGLKEFLDSIGLEICDEEEVLIFDKEGGFAIVPYRYKEGTEEKAGEEFAKDLLKPILNDFLLDMMSSSRINFKQLCFTNYTANDFVHEEKNYTEKYIEFMVKKFGNGYKIGNNKNYYAQQRKRAELDNSQEK